ncbi:MAG: hypothetical protein E6Q90_06510 [Actinobacteria bacterium]|nr:MAG: hypothetical protein E6Q90_06510 [Actinomycetota bacterium]
MVPPLAPPSGAMASAAAVRTWLVLTAIAFAEPAARVSPDAAALMLPTSPRSRASAAARTDLR